MLVINIKQRIGNYKFINNIKNKKSYELIKCL